MEGTEAKMTNIRPSDLRSLPWITILDANGDVLGKSDLIPDDLRLYLQRIREKLHQLRDRFGTNHPTVLTLESINQQFKDDNYGFPSEHEAVDRFLAMLEAAAEAISDNDITILRNSLLGEVPKVP